MSAGQPPTTDLPVRPPACGRALPVARLAPWTAVQAGVIRSLTGHLLSREGATHACRQGMARREGALPLYGDSQHWLLADESGTLYCLAAEGEPAVALATHAATASAHFEEWLAWAWQESLSLLPAGFGMLKLRHTLQARDSGGGGVISGRTPG